MKTIETHARAFFKVIIFSIGSVFQLPSSDSPLGRNGFPSKCCRVLTSFFFLFRGFLHQSWLLTWWHDEVQKNWSNDIVTNVRMTKIKFATLKFLEFLFSLSLFLPFQFPQRIWIYCWEEYVHSKNEPWNHHFSIWNVNR